jgi:glycosyltransferase involved in cell wall biosynthesis
MIAVSEHVRRELLAVGFPSARIRTILNGIDLQRASRTVRSKEQVFSDLGIQPDQRLLLMIGWDPIRKGVDLAGEAVGRLVEQGERLVLVILGGEPLRRYLSERKPGGAPPWMRCIEPTEDMGSLYGAAAAFLSPSRSEGFTYAACEAMAGGTPAVLADIPAVGWAQACPAAAFCAPGDGHALCAAIRSVLSWSPVERQRRAAEGRQFVRRGFDVRRWAEQVVEFYHERQ